MPCNHILERFLNCSLACRRMSSKISLVFLCKVWVFFLLKVVQREREEKLAEILKDRLNLYVQGNKEDFVHKAEAEVLRLSTAGNMLFVYCIFHIYLSFMAWTGCYTVAYMPYLYFIYGLLGLFETIWQGLLYLQSVFYSFQKGNSDTKWLLKKARKGSTKDNLILGTQACEFHTEYQLEPVNPLVLLKSNNKHKTIKKRR